MALIVFHVQDASAHPIAGADLKATSTFGPWEGVTNPCGDFFATLGAGHYDITVTAPGFKPRVLPADLADSGIVTIGLDSQAPTPVQQPPLPPFDGNGPGGELIHTALPPDQVIPPRPTLAWWRGDFAGVTLDASFGTPPFFPGANTTPPQMLMSPQIIEYPREWQDRYLTAYCERGYTHFVLDSIGWGLNLISTDAFLAWAKYVQSWGLYSVYWGNATASDPFLTTGLAAKSIDVFIVGEELNGKTSPGTGANGLDSIIAANCAETNPVGVPTYLHFTSNYPSWQPNGMTPTQWWSEYTGKLAGLCWQGDQNNGAALMSAHMWDARREIAAASKDFHVVAYELQATNELYGKCDEAHGCLCGWEQICATSDGSAPPVAGFGNGCRFPNGDPV